MFVLKADASKCYKFIDCFDPMNFVRIRVPLFLAMTFTAVSLAVSGVEPQSAAAHVRKGSERLRDNDLAAAESELRGAIQLGTRDPQAYNLLGLRPHEPA